MDFKAFLANIDVENNEGAEMEILLTINGEEEIFIAKISDQHIFLVHK